MTGIFHTGFRRDPKTQQKTDKKDRHALHDISEAPSAYKDIDVVMENQKDLVDIVVKLRPLAVMKG